MSWPLACTLYFHMLKLLFDSFSKLTLRLLKMMAL